MPGKALRLDFRALSHLDTRSSVLLHIILRGDVAALNTLRVSVLQQSWMWTEDDESAYLCGLTVVARYKDQLRTLSRLFIDDVGHDDGPVLELPPSLDYIGLVPRPPYFRFESQATQSIVALVQAPHSRVQTVEVLNIGECTRDGLDGPTRQLREAVTSCGVGFVRSGTSSGRCIALVRRCPRSC